MLVQNFAKNNIDHLTPDSTVREALMLMDKEDFDIYPVISGHTEYLSGVLHRSDIEETPSMEQEINAFELRKDLSVEEGKHVFEAIRLVLMHEVRLLVVVDNEGRYKGIIRKQEMMEALSELLNLSELGSILTIEMEQYDFTLTKLIELIETEGAKILGLAVETPSNQDNKFRVSIKLNTRKTGSITETLRRFGYHVTTNTNNDYSEIDYQARASELLHYIDM